MLDHWLRIRHIIAISCLLFSACQRLGLDMCAKTDQRSDDLLCNRCLSITFVLGKVHARNAGQVTFPSTLHSTVTCSSAKCVLLSPSTNHNDMRLSAAVHTIGRIIAHRTCPTLRAINCRTFVRNNANRIRLGRLTKWERHSFLCADRSHMLLACLERDGPYFVRRGGATSNSQTVPI